MTLSAPLWTVLHASWHAAILAALILVVQALLRRHLPARWRFALWFLVLVRLSLIPLPESRWSLYNFLPTPDRAARLLPSGAAPLPAAAPSDVVIAAAAPLHVAPSPLSAWTIVAVLYLFGLALVLLRTLFAALALRRIIRRSTPVTDPALLSSLEAARRAVQLRRPLAMRLSSDLASPAVVGILRPCLLLPPEVLAAFTAAELRFILLHECAHVRRNDVALNYWLALAAAVHWFNPAVWLLLPRIRADRELACDETVLLHTGESAAYGETLLKLLESSRPARPLVGAVGVLENRSFFKRRIRMIAAFRKTPAWLATPALGLAVVLAGATLTTAVTAAAQTVAGVAASEKTAPGPSAEELDLRSRLDKHIKEIAADAQPLEKVFAYVQDTAGINLSVNWQALEAAGVNRNTPVTLKLTNVTTRRLLNTLLASVSAGGANVRFAVEENVLVISTVDELTSPPHQFTRIYDVRDLIVAPRLDATGAATQAQISAQGEENDLSQTIMTTVLPEAWHDARMASLRIYKGMLIVTAPSLVQDQVVEMVGQLRAAMKSGNIPAAKRD